MKEKYQELPRAMSSDVTTGDTRCLVYQVRHDFPNTAKNQDYGLEIKLACDLSIARHERHS